MSQPQLSIKALAAAAVLLLAAGVADAKRTPTAVPHSLTSIPCVGVGAGVLGGGQEIEVCPPVAGRQA